MGASNTTELLSRVETHKEMISSKAKIERD
jgi:hypothetical protein